MSQKITGEEMIGGWPQSFTHQDTTALPIRLWIATQYATNNMTLSPDWALAKADQLIAAYNNTPNPNAQS